MQIQHTRDWVRWKMHAAYRKIIKRFKEQNVTSEQGISGLRSVLTRRKRRDGLQKNVS